MPPVLFPDAVLAAVTYLREQLGPDVRVTQRLPTAPPTTATVVVRRAGGVARALVLDQARVDVQVWHTDEDQAAQLAQLVRAHLLAAAGRTVAGALVVKAKDFLGPQAVPDKATGQPRYLLTVQWSLRGTQLT